MNRAVVNLFSIGLLLICTSESATSQRSFSAIYDSSRQVKFQGVVTRIDWVNPSAFFFVDVHDSTGTVANWAVEVGNPLDRNAMAGNRIRSYWRSSDVDAIAARGETRQASAKSVMLTKTGKKLFGPTAARRAALPPAPVPVA